MIYDPVFILEKYILLKEVSFCYNPNDLYTYYQFQSDYDTDVVVLQ